MTILRWMAALTLLLGLGRAQDLADRVSTYTLDNGLRVIFVRQPAAPVIAFNLTFAVGGADEPDGLGGIAHMVEHMAFKGTPTIGSLDPQAEAEALAAVEVSALALEYQRRHGSEAEIAAAEAAFAAAQERAQALADPSPLDDLLSPNGAVGLNASTAYDRTSYTVSLPSNRLELYARVYADELLDPTFRAFYAERDVVREERRQRSEDDPQGYLFEAFLQAAFERHPYGRPLIGSPEAIAGYTATEAKAFFELYYHPEEAVLVLVGDVEPERDIDILRRYFGVLPAGSPPRSAVRREGEQTAERRVAVTYDAEPQLVIGYHKPTYPDRDAYTLDLISALLSSGRTSRLYERMVLEDGTALDVSTSSAFPGSRFDNLFIFYGQSRSPATPDDLESAFYDEIERLKREPVSERELEKIRNQVRAAAVRSLTSAEGLAENLAYNELFLGSWERFLTDFDLYQTITPAEIQAVAQRIFTPENRTVAVLLKEAQ